MGNFTFSSAVQWALGLALLSGCAGSPVAPFNNMKTANVTMFRLQNFEPPPTVAAAPAGVPMLGLPPEIQKWVQAGASMLPPNLLPPGLLPGQPAVSAPAVDATQRFAGFRILGQTRLSDEKLRSDIGNIFGVDSNFDDSFSPCMFAELGLRVENMGQPPADLLVSLSCDRVQATTFAWPHRHGGLKPDTVQRITKLMQRAWGSTGG